MPQGPGRGSAGTMTLHQSKPELLSAPETAVHRQQSSTQTVLYQVPRPFNFLVERMPAALSSQPHFWTRPHPTGAQAQADDQAAQPNTTQVSVPLPRHDSIPA